MKKDSKAEKEVSSHSENNHNVNINNNNTINNTTNHVAPDNPKEGSWAKIAAVATVIGVIATIYYSSSSSGDSQSFWGIGSNIEVKQNINKGMSNEEICQKGEERYLKRIDEIGKRISNSSFDVEKELQTYQKRLDEYKKSCYEGK